MRYFNLTENLAYFMQFFRYSLLVTMLFVGLISSAWGQEKAHVLLLNSYHYGLSWTDSETQGIREVLEKSGLSIELHVEYMDTKRLADEVHFKNLRQLLNYKYRNTQFSSILVADNDAFNFIRQYRNEAIFTGVPVIFAGVNFFHQDMLAGLSGFTGVAESFEAGQTVAVMQRLHPGVRRIIVIIDATTTGEAIQKEMAPMLAPYADQIHFEFWNKTSLEQLRARLPDLKKDALVLLMPYSRDSLGKFISFPDIAALVAGYSPVPVYSTYEFYMGYGVVGGRLTLGEAQGRAAAEILLRVLGGENPNQISVMRVSPTEFEFDARQLHHYDIANSVLPPGSRVLFQSWFELYRAWVLLGVVVLSITLLLSFGWIRSYRLERQSALTIKRSKEQLEAILNSTSESIFHVDESGMILAINDIAAHRVHQEPLSMIGRSAFEFFPHEVAVSRRNTLAEVFRTARETRTEDSRDNHFFLLSYYPIADNDGKVSSVVVYAADITERKKLEIELSIAATTFESQEGMLVTDANSVILRVNQAFTSITGYTAEEAIGQTPRLLSSGRQNAAFYGAMWDSINRTGEWQGEIWNKRKSGDVYPEQLTITAVKNSLGGITNYVATLTDITTSKAAAEEIKHLAFYDLLTRLPNRRLLLDRLNQALASSARSAKSGALLFIDLDNFKTLNDTLGHDIGDLLLQQVARRLESCIREGDTVARLGGDEFVVMLEDLSDVVDDAAAQAEVVGEKILFIINQPYQLGTNDYNTTPSIGVTLFKEHQSSIDDLLKQADIAMYQAKHEGRNRLRFFDQKMQDTINARVALEGELRKALEQRQFQLYYQIQVDSSYKPLGAEALIRWFHPERGMVSPFYFIPLAEDTELILPIGQWVLDTACAQLKTWQQEPLTRDLVLAVNVSARQFYQADFVSRVRTAINEYDIDPKLLKLELTESMLVKDIEDTIATMKALNEIGIRFSLDDFGTGYSSLQYLKRLPLDQLKIDQSFVRDISTNLSDKTIVRTIIAMAESLNLNVIAEGVETEEQREILMGRGCKYYQGYLFGKPLPIEQFEALLKPT